MLPASTSPKKPSPLSWGSPRPSPFKRPESPLLRSPSALRASTPPISPVRLSAEPVASSPTTRSFVDGPVFAPPTQSPNQPASPPTIRTFAPSATSPRTVVSSSPVSSATYTPRPTARYGGGGSAATTPTRTALHLGGGDAVSRLDPARVLEMRDAFQVLDRDDDGQVTRDDVIEMLAQLGQDASTGAASAFFPAAGQSTMNLSSYLNTLSSLLAPLSSTSELNAAFAAFDLDDSGQVDVHELRNALLHSAPEAGERAPTERDINTVMEGFSGRREFSKGMGKDGGKRGEVFRYTEFVGAIAGGGKASSEAGGLVSA